MAAVHRVGPCHAFIGDPTQASGAGMTYLGITRGDVRVTPGINVVVGRADQTGRTPRADSVHTIGPTPVVSVPFVDEEKAKLEAYVAGSTVTTNGGHTALGFGSGFAQVAEADIGTLALIPVLEIASGTNGIEAANAVWLPAALANDIGEFRFNLPEGDDIFQPHETQFIGLYREEDQDGTPNTIPADARVIFFGTPEAFTALASQWSLPAVS